MTRATLAEVLQPALKNRYAVAGLVCLGWEDMLAYIRAAEAENCPVILQAGPGCREHTPIPILAKMFLHLADNTSVPVVAHLDHGYSSEECREAIDSGFTSVMYDGSRKPLQQNIDETAAIAEMAHSAGVSAEGEIGFVGYDGGEASDGTDPQEAERFASETGVDAMAVSVGNIHLQQDAGQGLDIDRIREIDSRTTIPLVIHGGSGVPARQRTQLAQQTSICKFNIGTELRMAFGSALREAVNRQSDRFDRLSILKETIDPLTVATRSVLRDMRGTN
ncbi:MAG: class II fructose-bisphosphate aldolase [Granulosicoccus sp.]|nr:class II fructose-bisphosphate aldolase [Granulosicoccus sp.]